VKGGLSYAAEQTQLQLAFLPFVLVALFLVPLVRELFSRPELPLLRFLQLPALFLRQSILFRARAGRSLLHQPQQHAGL